MLSKFTVKDGKIPYGLRIAIAVFLLVSVCLTILSLTLYGSYSYQSKKLMRDYNQKLINQVVSKYNLINDTIVEMIIKNYNQSSVIKLIYQEEIDKMEYNLTVNNLSDAIKSYPMYHSAILYNNQNKKFTFLNINEDEAKPVSDNIFRGNVIPAMCMVPVEITHLGEKELVFSYYIYEYLTDASVMNGALVLNLHTDWIEEIVQELEIDNLNFMIIDENGRVIMDSSQKLPYGASFNRNYKERISNLNSNISFSETVDGERVLVTANKLEKTSWTLICEQPFTFIYSQFINPLKINTFIALFILLIITFSGVLVTLRYTLTPIRKKIRILQTSSDGEYDGKDELECIMRVLSKNENQRLQICDMESNISDIKKGNYLKLLLKNFNIEGKDEDAKRCIEFISNGSFFAIMLKPENGVYFDEISALWREWSGSVFPEFEVVVMNELEIITIVKESGTNRNLRAKFKKDYFDFQKRIIDSFNIKSSIFVTDYYGSNDFNMLYPQLQKIKKYELMYTVGCYLDSEILSQQHNFQKTDFPVAIQNQLMETLRRGELDKSEEIIGNFIDKILCGDVDEFRTSIMRLAIGIQTVIEEKSLFNKNESMHESDEVIKELLMAQNLEVIFNCFMRLFSLACGADATTESKNGTYSALIYSVSDYINQNYADPNLNLEQLSEVFKMSPNYLGRLFKDEMGQSVGSFITDVRLNKSLVLLKNSNTSIKSILEKIGFVSESSFFKQFKKKYGITPKEYRINKILIDLNEK